MVVTSVFLILSCEDELVVTSRNQNNKHILKQMSQKHCPNQIQSEISTCPPPELDMDIHTQKEWHLVMRWPQVNGEKERT